MQPAADAMAEALADEILEAPAVPVIANVTAEPEAEGEGRIDRPPSAATRKNATSAGCSGMSPAASRTSGGIAASAAWAASERLARRDSGRNRAAASAARVAATETPEVDASPARARASLAEATPASNARHIPRESSSSVDFTSLAKRVASAALGSAPNRPPPEARTRVQARARDPKRRTRPGRGAAPKTRRAASEEARGREPAPDAGVGARSAAAAPIPPIAKGVRARVCEVVESADG